VGCRRYGADPEAGMLLAGDGSQPAAFWPVTARRGLSVMRKPLLGRWEADWGRWAGLTLYQRFEVVVALMLTLIISMVILVALYRLFVGVLWGLVFDSVDPLDHNVFQSVFGEIMTLLIALEFNHTLQYVVNRTQSIIQTRVVLLIALLAVARKVIILDLHQIEVGAMLGLAAIILVLGTTYWLIREQDDHLPGAKPGTISAGDRADVNTQPIRGKTRTASGAMEKFTAT
jgi:uncharacterized membrane protein (DUF373 family)